MSTVISLRTQSPIIEETQPEQCLVFSNKGAIDINLVKILGVSVKDSDNPIGFFGTGLKYAIATTLRLGGSITIYTDGKRYDLTGRELVLRGKAFTQVILNDEALGFTTDLGKQWEAWMVVRELYSNALDENGNTLIRGEDPEEFTQADETTIVLRGDDFLEIWDNRQQYFLSSTERRVHTSKFVDAFDVLGHNHAVFYRGIKVFDTNLPTLHRYNILSAIDLTEDRTLKYEFELKEAVERSIITSTDRDYIERCLTAGDYTFEGWLTFSDPHSSVTMSDEFKEVCRELNKTRPQRLNARAIAWYESKAKTFQPFVPAQITRVQQKQLDKATAFVKAIGIGDDLDSYPIIVVNWLGENVDGLAKDRTIYISKECFDKGTKYLASTILEEFVHCRYSYRDCTRQLQTWLFDRIISMGEEFVTGEPL